MMKHVVLTQQREVYSLATYKNLLAVGFDDGRIEIFSKMRFSHLERYLFIQKWKAHQNWVWNLFFTADGKSLASASLDGSVKMWDLEFESEEEDARVSVSLVPKWIKTLPGSVYALDLVEPFEAFTKPGGYAIASFYSRLCVIDLNSGDAFYQKEDDVKHTLKVTAVISLGRFYKNMFASGSLDNSICVSEISADDDGCVRPRMTQKVTELGSAVKSLCLSPCGKMVVAGSEEGVVYLFHLPDWNVVWECYATKNDQWGIRSISFSPDGHFVAYGSLDGNLGIISSETGVKLRTFEGHLYTASKVLFSEDGKKFISGSVDKTVRVRRLCEQDDRIASLLSDRTFSDLVYQGEDVFKKLFCKVRTKLIG